MEAANGSIMGHNGNIMETASQLIRQKSCKQTMSNELPSHKQKDNKMNIYLNPKITYEYECGCGYE